MNPDLAWKLGFKIRRTNIGAQKINGFALEIFGIVIADFQVENKVSRPKFFQETFLVTDTKFMVILRMIFLKISNTNVLFAEKTLMQKFYTINKALPIIKKVQIIVLKEFIIITLDADSEMFTVYVAIRK